MNVEPCYPLFSAKLESAEALASSQQIFQTLNLADYKVMRQLLPITLVCHPMCPVSYTHLTLPTIYSV